MDEIEALIKKLQRVEALHAGTNFEGERDAAANVIESIKRRIEACDRETPPKNYKFTLADAWSRKLMVALLRRYGFEPYRLPRQRHTTVMARVSDKFVDETLWPQFCELSDALETYLSEVTEKVIRSAIHEDNSEISDRDEQAALPHTPQ